MGASSRRGGALAAELALGPAQKPRNIFMMPDPEQNREHKKERRLRPLSIDPERDRRRRAGEEPGERRVARERGDREPDEAEADGDGPRQRDQDADINRHPLATLE